jgi:hypothetical protein
MRNHLLLLFLILTQANWSSKLVAGTFIVSSREQLLELVARLQAGQFLVHATFGPSQAEIDDLATRMRQIGTLAAASEWMDQQQNTSLTPATSHVATLESFVAQDGLLCSCVDSSNAPVSPILPIHIPNHLSYRHQAWWHNSIAAPDQLRQKTAWALSQVFPVGFNAADFNVQGTENPGIGPNGPVQKARYVGLTDYYDLFVRESFGSFRDLLQRVTYHAIMGDWLSSRANAKANPALNRFPDENFAREVMQLFSIGLHLLNDDGTQVLDSSQNAIPTYNNDTIREYAKVFTGLGYNGSGGAWGTAGTNAGFVSVRYSTPMTMASTQHEPAAKVLLGRNLDALPNPPTRAQCEADIVAALDSLFTHQSCPPFICRLLIQRLVKSNPSRAYMNRVVRVFKDNGFGQRGDLKALVRAILLDPEAWQPIRTTYLRQPNRIVVTTLGTEDSRLQEPVVNYTRILRALKAVAYYEKGSTVLDASQTRAIVNYDTANPLSNQFRLESRFDEFFQNPYETPSVFNFYLPDYQPSGEIGAYIPSPRIPLGVVVAPEFQIVNAISSNQTGNFLRKLIVEGGRTEQHYSGGSFRAGNPPTIQLPVQRVGTLYSTTLLHATRCRVVLDPSPGYPFLTTQASLAASLPAVTGGMAPLVENLDFLLCQGTMNEMYRTKLIQVLDQQRAAAGATVDTTEALNLAVAAVLCAVQSPNFLVSN